MNWLDRALASLRRAVRDLISEEEVPETDRTTALLAAARVRIDALRIEMDEATARGKRAELEWQKAQADLHAVNRAIDALLQAGRDDVARENLKRAQEIQSQADQWNASRHEYEQITARLRREIQALQTQLGEIERQTGQLDGRQRNVETLELLNQLRRDLRRFATATSAALDDRQEQIARREDRLAARDEIDNAKREL